MLCLKKLSSPCDNCSCLPKKKTVFYNNNNNNFKLYKYSQKLSFYKKFKLYKLITNYIL